MKDTILSLIRHVVTLLGGVLLAKGYIDESIAAFLPGALCVLTGALWGAVDEYKVTGQKVHFWLSVVRHALTAIGGYFAASGKISAETVDLVIGAILALAGTLWGHVDEATYAAEHPGSDAAK
ncbi:MAG: hypothetical protein LBM92_03005 [Opitutaceae bacterium]|jgi:hypothetical protein|nr:hypothetical protein [Opitutaceae bacterium]